MTGYPNESKRLHVKIGREKYEKIKMGFNKKV
jgi:hypothetical protein